MTITQSIRCNGKKTTLHSATTTHLVLFCCQIVSREVVSKGLQKIVQARLLLYKVVTANAHLEKTKFLQPHAHNLPSNEIQTVSIRFQIESNCDAALDVWRTVQMTTWHHPVDTLCCAQCFRFNGHIVSQRLRVCESPGCELWMCTLSPDDSDDDRDASSVNAQRKYACTWICESCESRVCLKCIWSCQECQQQFCKTCGETDKCTEMADMCNTCYDRLSRNFKD